MWYVRERRTFWAWVGKPEGRRPIRRRRVTWQDNNKKRIFKKQDGGRWTGLTWPRIGWWDFVKMVMNLRVSIKCRKFPD